ncbi:alpha-galactosidase [Synchytrium microbalum]|uniref:Alpha-galactosidase n=1 Tax=Synchytrium microbalum TaxID=1806994 RepID=A0A507C6T1_9FUNG|nr:alpha-galactosidase [Synchytrium microbalum]TPX33253.1 alpha-galactosidase [Synchytrium microbalum]
MDWAEHHQWGEIRSLHALLAWKSLKCISPPPSFNSWNRFGCGINEGLFRKTADRLIELAGYEYVNIDDCWQVDRLPDGTIGVDPRFPNGMKALADYVHDKGLKFGLYSSAGTMTCEKRPGSLNFEVIDARTYAAWDVDYLKYDNCFNENIPALTRGQESPWLWGPEVANAWRTTGDIRDKWMSVIYILDLQVPIAQHSRPQGFNDMDMLEVGNGVLTTGEYRSHFSLWSALKSPLLIGCDLDNISPIDLEILLAPEIMAVNQDPLGISAIRVWKEGDLDVWSGPLSSGDKVSVLFNRASHNNIISVPLTALGYPPATLVLARDLWRRQDIGTYQTTFSANVPPHGVVVIKTRSTHEQTSVVKTTIYTPLYMDEDVIVAANGTQTSRVSTSSSSIPNQAILAVAGAGLATIMLLQSRGSRRPKL